MVAAVDWNTACALHVPRVKTAADCRVGCLKSAAVVQKTYRVQQPPRRVTRECGVSGAGLDRRVVQCFHCGRMRAAEHAPRGPCRFFERRHGLAEIVERGAGVHVERLRVTPPHPEREIMTLSENASRHGYRFAQQRLGFFEALFRSIRDNA